MLKKVIVPLAVLVGLAVVFQRQIKGYIATLFPSQLPAQSTTKTTTTTTTPKTTTTTKSSSGSGVLAAGAMAGNLGSLSAVNTPAISWIDTVSVKSVEAWTDFKNWMHL